MDEIVVEVGMTTKAKSLRLVVTSSTWIRGQDTSKSCSSSFRAKLTSKWSVYSSHSNRCTLPPPARGSPRCPRRSILAPTTHPQHARHFHRLLGRGRPSEQGCQVRPSKHWARHGPRGNRGGRVRSLRRLGRGAVGIRHRTLYVLRRGQRSGNCNGRCRVPNNIGLLDAACWRLVIFPPSCCVCAGSTRFAP